MLSLEQMFDSKQWERALMKISASWSSGEIGRLEMFPINTTFQMK